MEASRRARASDVGVNRDPDADLELADGGGTDTFFAWFFRGEGPLEIISGANIQGRFIQASSTYATFFEDNYVMDLLGARPGGVAEALQRELGVDRATLIVEFSAPRKVILDESEAASEERSDASRARRRIGASSGPSGRSARARGRDLA